MKAHITPHDARHPERLNADGRINAATADWLSRHAEDKSEIRPELSNGSGVSRTARKVTTTRVMPPKPGKNPDLKTAHLGVAHRDRHGCSCLRPRLAGISHTERKTNLLGYAQTLQTKHLTEGSTA